MQLPSTKVIDIPEHVNATLVARLARSIVMELQPLDRILEEFKLTRDQFEVVKLTSYFKRVSEEFAAEWNKITSTQDRLRLISAVLLEEGLPRTGSFMVDPNVTPAVAVDAGKFLAKIAGVGEGAKGSETAAGDRFTITINLGEDQQVKFTKDVTPRTDVSPLSGEVEGVQSITEGETEEAPMGAEPEGERVGQKVSSKPDGETE